jgi:hypothetical protein
MAIGKSSRIVDSDKPVAELFASAERALAAIGTVKESDQQGGRLRGATRYGLQKVKLTIEVCATDSGSRMTVLGGSDDIAGVGANQGIARLLEVLENPEKAQGDADYLKRGMSKATIAWVLAGFVVLLLLIVLRGWLAVN